jgi:DNA modification methylase
MKLKERRMKESRYRVEVGDCRDRMKELEAESIDSIVTDPPYGLSFMGKEWDYGVPGSAFWVEALRVAKPGAHLLAFGGTRTFHRLAVAIEDAGWEIRDCVMWLYGSGFPKSHNIGKAIDKCDAIDQQHARRLQFTAWVRSQNVTAKQINDATKTQMGGHYTAHSTQPAIMTREHLEMCRHLFSDIPTWVEDMCDVRSVESSNMKRRPIVETVVAPNHPGFSSTRFHKDVSNKRINKTTSYTDDAKRWEGWGTALKPAWEPIIVARKPFVGTVAENVVRYGTGAINVEACRIGSTVETWPSSRSYGGKTSCNFTSSKITHRAQSTGSAPSGRWPANIIHDGSDEVSDPLGSAARFFYCAKASKADRDDGCDGLKLVTHQSVMGGAMPVDDDGNSRDRFKAQSRNHHPTVKPTSLMRYLCRLVTPPGGTVLDPFTGSGSTGRGAMHEGFNFIGFELSPEYAEIARARIAACVNSEALF